MTSEGRASCVNWRVGALSSASLAISRRATRVCPLCALLLRGAPASPIPSLPGPSPLAHLSAPTTKASPLNCVQLRDFNSLKDSVSVLASTQHAYIIFYILLIPSMAWSLASMSCNWNTEHAAGVSKLATIRGCLEDIQYLPFLTSSHVL